MFSVVSIVGDGNGDGMIVRVGVGAALNTIGK
jgi:hypothetical protein